MTTLPAALVQALSTYADRSPRLVATDFDGVLAPLVDDPMTSRAVPGSMEALSALAALPGTTVALVSGRDLATLRLLSGLPESSPVVLIGSHGAESTVDLGSTPSLDDASRRRLSAATDHLTEVVASHPDARIEHKPAGVVLHTRGIDPAQAESATAAALLIPDAEPGVHAMHGKDVVELSVLETSKGQALQSLSRLRGTDATLYLGDDVTDEKAFAVLPTADGHVTVKVGEGPTIATHRVPDPAAVLELLTTLTQAVG